MYSSTKLKLYDTILVTEAYSESSYASTMGVSNDSVLCANKELNDLLRKNAKELNIDIVEGRIHSSDVFYRLEANAHERLRDEHGVIAVEMESFALFANAQALNKQATCLLTVSDSLVTHEATTSEERQLAFTTMMELALSLAE